MSDGELAFALQQLPEIYQPIYGVDGAVSSRSADLPRTQGLLSVLDMVSATLKRPLRVLDLGCAQGFFCFLAAERGHHVTGVENLPANVEVVRLICTRHPDLSVEIVEADIVEFVNQLSTDTYDIVIGFSVLHHIIHGHGHSAAVHLVAQLRTHVQFGVFEMALCEEPVYWSASLPVDPRLTLSPYRFIREIGESSTHLSDVSRPQFFCSSTHALVGDHLHAIERYAELSHPHFPIEASGSRRYYFFGGGMIKVAARFSADVDLMILDESLAEFRREVPILKKLRDVGLDTPQVLDFHESVSEVVVARTTFPGSLLTDTIASLTDMERCTVFEQVLTELAMLESLGWYHGDLRTWNVIWDATQQRARLVDFGSLRPDPTDVAWPGDAFYTFVIFTGSLFTGGADPVGGLLPRTVTVAPDVLPNRVGHLLRNAMLRPASPHFFADALADWSELKDIRLEPPDLPLCVHWTSAIGTLTAQDHGQKAEALAALLRDVAASGAAFDGLLAERNVLLAERDGLLTERDGLLTERQATFKRRLRATGGRILPEPAKRLLRALRRVF